MTAGLVLLFAATVDRFESLKGPGIEAKTRRLEEKIAEADDAVRKVRHLAELSGAALIDLNSKVGRYDGAPRPRESYELASKVRGILSGLGADELQIRGVLRPWATVTCRDLARSLAWTLHAELQQSLRQVDTQLGSVTRPINPQDQKYRDLLDAKKRANEAIATLNSAGKLKLEDFPERFLELIDAAERVNPGAAKDAREHAEQWREEMISLRTNADFKNPAKCLAHLEEAWDSRQI